MLSETFIKITNALPELHFLLTHDGTIIAVNQAVKKKIPELNSSVNTLNLDDLIVDESARLKPLLQMWSRSQSPLPANIVFKTDGGMSINYLCKGSVIRPALNNEPALLMMNCIDKHQSTSVFITLNEKIEQLKREISERHRIEQEVRLLNQELEERVRARTYELEEVNTELSRSLEKLKSTQDHLVRTEILASLGGMVAGVAHEINTPVGICVTAASFLEEQAHQYHRRYNEGVLTRKDFESFLDEALESSTLMLNNLSRAADLVSSFKQLAVDQTSDQRRHINLKSYIEELLISLQSYFHHTSHKFKLICPVDINIESYPGAIAQIINNLINNSMIHGFESIDGGLITIEVTCDQDNIQLHYSDNGIGISKENQAYIFDPFFTTKRNQGGSGLGLNIIYNLITNKLGGKIRFTSEELQNTHFYISLPVLTDTQQL